MTIIGILTIGLLCAILVMVDDYGRRILIAIENKD